MQAVQAKKHVTVFMRSPSAPGAGTPAIKAGFTACARETVGVASRQERNAKMQRCMKDKGLKTGEYRRKSRAKVGSPLHGKVYVNGVLT
jgi:hypothetical protein